MFPADFYWSSCVNTAIVCSLTRCRCFPGNPPYMVACSDEKNSFQTWASPKSTGWSHAQMKVHSYTSLTAIPTVCCLFDWRLLSMLQSPLMVVCKHTDSQSSSVKAENAQRNDLPAVFACKVWLQLPQSSAFILSSDSSVSCFCWIARCLLFSFSFCGQLHTGACFGHGRLKRVYLQELCEILTCFTSWERSRMTSSST